jgi:hypothetical protein
LYSRWKRHYDVVVRCRCRALVAFCGEDAVFVDCRLAPWTTHLLAVTQISVSLDRWSHTDSNE